MLFLLVFFEFYSIVTDQQQRQQQSSLDKMNKSFRIHTDEKGEKKKVWMSQKNLENVEQESDETRFGCVRFALF